MGLKRQAKILSKGQMDAVLGYLTRTRYPERNRAIFLLSVRAGLRAKEIASLTWTMLTDAEGNIGDAIHLVDQASKGRLWPRDSPQQGIEGGARSNPRGSGRGQALALRGHDGKSQADERGGDREPVRRLVSGPGLQRLLEPQRTSRIHHQRRPEDRRRRRVAERRAATGWTFIALDHPALHRSTCRCATADRRAGLTSPRGLPVKPAVPSRVRVVLNQTAACAIIAIALMYRRTRRRTKRCQRQPDRNLVCETN